MKYIGSKYKDYDDESRRIFLLLYLLPPPVSLDTLYSITDSSPVKILQIAEELVKLKLLTRARKMGAGYYHLTSPKSFDAALKELPQEDIRETCRLAIQRISDTFQDGPKKWLDLAHIYQQSKLVPHHFRELIQAGHYCRTHNLPADGAVYYRMALEAMEKAEPSAAEQSDFIDGTIGICLSRSNALSPKLQLRFAQRALEFSAPDSDPERHIRLSILTARALVKLGNYEEATRQFDLVWNLIATANVKQHIKLEAALAHSEFLFWQGLITDAIEKYESVLDSHEQLPADEETLKNYAVQGWIYGIAGETARGVGIVEAVREKAREIGANDIFGYSTLLLVFIFADARRMTEAELYLKELFNSPEIILDNFMLWPGNGKRSFLAYWHGDYERAFQYQKEAYENSKALNFSHHRGPDNFELMLGLEKRGFVHPEWNFAYEVDRLTKWPDIYMRGSMLRYRAQKKYDEGKSLTDVQDDLQQSIALLTRSGAKLELSLARIFLARILIQQNQASAAVDLLKPSWEILVKANPELFPEDLKQYLDPSSQNALWLDSLIQIGDAIGSIRDTDQLLSQIIKQAMRLAGAERGAVFLKNETEVEIAASRNLGSAHQSSDIFNQQQQIISDVLDTGMEFLHQETVCRPAADSSLCTKGWISCFPISLKGNVRGVLYLDCRLGRQPLSENEIALLRIICNQAAVALENAKAFEEINDIKSHLEAETHFYRENRVASASFGGMIGQSKPFRDVLQLIQQVAESDATVMITGETGAGKDLVAQAIHQLSSRANGPYIAVNLVALSPELIASELFGHEKGAFTGASHPHKGRFELANHGTLLLDDIDAFSLEIQAKMLRVLETRTFERVGGSDTLRTTFRLIATCNRNLDELVQQGKFRSDFYYRLNVFPIHVPPLRERKEDIPILTKHFINLLSRKAGKHFTSIPRKVIQQLQDYDWPGNIRELRHVIERAVLLSTDNKFTLPALETATQQPVVNEKVLTLREMETSHILRALSVCKGKVSGKGGAANLLGVKPTTLYSKMKRLGIEKNGYRLQDRQEMEY